MTRVAKALLIAALLGLAGCNSARVHPDIEIDLSPMRILPILTGTPPAKVSGEGAIAAVEGERGPIDVIRLGRRWTPGPRTVWIVVYRLSDAGPDADWSALTVDDQTGAIIAGFEAASLRAFGVPLPDW